ncbi:immunity 26/phosphotriesterase HocA family protein (plasmid) [Aliiroseovarius crassostreae]|uniref:Immunity 26/phosphotriesterase HocA family protein n=1 Tax=Aliiroseovarius crassostreae TaxID=154981 RepID=A0A9Q9HEK2_9RHOB|nr:immunity 26/phosphotriesterase HocA family protein [Aliiroseovarius crassostreae]UWP97182.1 immunity 26/phosphotriesterase HocA family protein [Aliiroseovarius crassostreae]
MAKLRAKPGEVYEIPLSGGSFGYVKCLPYGEYAFLNYQSAQKLENVEVLKSAETLFRIWVMNYAFNKNSSWKRIGVLELNEDEKRGSDFFKQDQLSGRLTIYREAQDNPAGYEERPATLEECRGLERAAVWNPEHVEDRLSDYFSGIENKWVKSLALK